MKLPTSTLFIKITKNLYSQRRARCRQGKVMGAVIVSALPLPNFNTNNLLF